MAQTRTTVEDTEQVSRQAHQVDDLVTGKTARRRNTRGVRICAAWLLTLAGAVAYVGTQMTGTTTGDWLLAPLTVLLIAAAAGVLRYSSEGQRVPERDLQQARQLTHELVSTPGGRATLLAVLTPSYNYWNVDCLADELELTRIEHMLLERSGGMPAGTASDFELLASPEATTIHAWALRGPRGWWDIWGDTGVVHMLRHAAAAGGNVLDTLVALTKVTEADTTPDSILDRVRYYARLFEGIDGGVELFSGLADEWTGSVEDLAGSALLVAATRP
jgi:hypothetical protein